MYDFKKKEAEILDFWRENKVFERSLELREKAKRFVFFEGPPTANGMPHIGHFLTRVYKDLYGRYKTMRGFYVLRKAGWDTHGLPVELEVEKQLGFKNKKDIEDYGIAKFNKKAKESVWKYKKEWEEMTKRMGFWLDLNDPYVTYQNNYIETLWHIIKHIWDRKLLYLAHRVIPFCTRCGTSLSSHEVAQGYKTVTDRSVYVKFKLKAGQKLGDHKISKNAFILAWTTTPWTLPGNVALAVGKDIDYVAAKKDKDIYLIAKDLAEKVLGQYEIEKELKGSDLAGLEYEPLFEVKDLKSKESYRVYEADFVSTGDGTGVVHTAVMYGEDDYELGTKIGLPKVHTVDEKGMFVGVSEDLDGKYVKDPKTEDLIIKKLEEGNLLWKMEPYEHEYPFCWRCSSPLLYYAKSSWFIKMSAVKDELIKNNEKINWIPGHIKEGRFGQWIKEGKDWAFSRERYWGTPLPIWKCQKCSSFKVVGSVADMEKKSSASNKNNYFAMRHGYTTRDERGKMLVSSDLKKDKYHLTEEGKEQIQKTAEKIKNNFEIDLIFCSPFKRTTETAEIVGKLLHVKAEKDDRLGEIVHGGCEGHSHRDCPIKEPRLYAIDKTHPTGESWLDVRLRLSEFMQEMESKYSGKNILIVSHGDPLWILNHIAEGLSVDGIMARSDGHYPGIAEFKELNWRNIPRNEQGELDLHRPFIDSVSLKCDECGASMKKIPDLIDVWFDSGAMPFAQWHWPFENEKVFKDQFPADFIVEGIDQTRGWFYTLLAISTLLGKDNPYKNVMALGHTLDEKGKKMSKSLGNVIRPDELMDFVGVDATRWYFYSATAMGESMIVSQRGAQERLKGFIFTLQNCVRFYELYSEQNSKIQNLKLEKKLNLLDQWVLSRYNQLLDEATAALDAYDPAVAARAIEKFVVEDFSNWWLRRSRKRKDALGLLRFLLLEISKLIAPFTPFVAEDIYRRLNLKFKIENLKLPESIHLQDWPAVNKKLINKKLEEEMKEVKEAVALGLAFRKERQLKVRQPLRQAIVKRKTKFKPDLEGLIKEELNVKKIAYDLSQSETVVLDTELDQALLHEGYARELIRQLQDMRKEAGYRMDEKVFGQWHSDDGEISSAIHEWVKEIQKEAVLGEFVSGPHDKKAYDVEKEMDLVPGRKIWIGVRR